MNQQRHIQRPDVDTQLQGICRGYPTQVSAGQLLLDLPSFVWQIPATIGAHRASQMLGIIAQIILDVTVD